MASRSQELVHHALTKVTDLVECQLSKSCAGYLQRLYIAPPRLSNPNRKAREPLTYPHNDRMSQHMELEGLNLQKEYVRNNTFKVVGKE